MKIKNILKKIVIIKTAKKRNTLIKTIHFSNDLNVGKNCLIGKNVYIENDVTIGDFTYLNSAKSISIDSNVSIGKFCSIAPGVNIAQGNHDITKVTTHPFLYDKHYAGCFQLGDNQYRYLGLPDNNYRTTVGNDVWIGMNAIIKRGVTIGSGAVIGAGAVVTKNVPDYAVVTGVPAQIIKYRFTEKQIQALLKIEWWNKSEEFIKKHFEMFYDINEFIKSMI